MQRLFTLTIIVLALTMGGCVAKSAFEEKSAEADRLTSELTSPGTRGI